MNILALDLSLTATGWARQFADERRRQDRSGGGEGHDRMNILALDLSLTATGWARQFGDELDHGVIRPRTRGLERLREYRWSGLPDLIIEYWRLPLTNWVAVIEGYSFRSRQSHAHALGELGGVMRLGLHDLGVPIVEVPPSSLKKFATGRGNASKELVLVEAVKRLGYDGSDHNVADALWLREMARVHYDMPGAVALPKTHLAALQKIEWPDL